MPCYSNAIMIGADRTELFLTTQLYEAKNSFCGAALNKIKQTPWPYFAQGLQQAQGLVVM